MEDKKFLSRHDIDIRLNGCLVKYKNKYYHASVMDERAEGSSTHLHLLDLKTHKVAGSIDANSSAFQYQFYNSLGWMPPTLTPEEFSTCLYIARAPYRRYKAGLAGSCLNVLCDSSSNGILRDNVHVSAMESDSFINMLEDKYPSVKEIIEFINKFPAPFSTSFIRKHGQDERFVNIALSREWAIRIDDTRGKTVPVKAHLLFGLSLVGSIYFEKGYVTFQERFNNSFYWEKFNESFINHLFIQTDSLEC
jgi:hypothetical protein